MTSSKSTSIQLPLPIEGLTTEIPLTQGYIAVIDAIDADLLSFRWYAAVRKHALLVYAYRGTRRRGIYKNIGLHRTMLARMLGRELNQNEQVDHIDGNGLHNQRANLRLATNTQNMRNKSLYRNNTSGTRGVSWHKRDQMWGASIRVNKRNIHLGYFPDLQDAIEARRVAELQYFGEFSPTLSRN